MIRVTDKKCRECKYHTTIAHTTWICCYYIVITGHSRVFVDGRQVVPDGYCKCFEKGNPARVDWINNEERGLYENSNNNNNNGGIDRNTC